VGAIGTIIDSHATDQEQYGVQWSEKETDLDWYLGSELEKVT